jgi:hypothetical protein
VVSTCASQLITVTVSSRAREGGDVMLVISGLERVSVSTAVPRRRRDSVGRCK